MKTPIQKAVQHCTTDLEFSDLTLDDLREVRGDWTNFCEAMLKEWDEIVERMEEEEMDAQDEDLPGDGD